MGIVGTERWMIKQLLHTCLKLIQILVRSDSAFGVTLSLSINSLPSSFYGQRL